MPSIDIIILNGLPVTIEFTVQEAEPDVGYMSPYLDDWEITHVNGRKTKSTYWLLKRIDAIETDRIMQMCYNSIKW